MQKCVHEKYEEIQEFEEYATLDLKFREHSNSQVSPTRLLKISELYTVLLFIYFFNL